MDKLQNHLLDRRSLSEFKKNVSEIKKNFSCDIKVDGGIAEGLSLAGFPECMGTIRGNDTWERYVGTMPGERYGGPPATSRDREKLGRDHLTPLNSRACATSRPSRPHSLQRIAAVLLMRRIPNKDAGCNTITDSGMTAGTVAASESLSSLVTDGSPSEIPNKDAGCNTITDSVMTAGTVAASES